MSIKVNRIAMTTEGAVEGCALGTNLFTVFKGVPYAQPPVGENRWRQPKPPQKREGILPCKEFKGAAPQALYRVNSSGEKFPKASDPDANDVYFEESEDCLYLNIWTPRVSEDAMLPVLFWMHGGRYTSGSSYEDYVDGEIFCRNNAILVSVGYRLGVFANFGHPQLVEEHPLGACGTLGIQDLIQALKWLKENIRAFGGDPDNITIGGQSAGGNLTDALLVSPYSQGLFRRAVIHSTGILLDTDTHHSKEEACEIGSRICEILGMGIDELRELPTIQVHERIMAAANEIGELEFMPAIDGVLLKEPVYVSLSKGEHADADLLASSVSGDSVVGRFRPTTVENFETLAKVVGGDRWREIVSLFGAEEEEKMPQAYKKVRRYFPRMEPLSFAIAEAKNGKKPVYISYFDRKLPGDDRGAFHTAELWYLFGSFTRSWRARGHYFTGVDYELSEMMCRYWTNFMRTGDPNGEGLTKWRPFKADDPFCQYFDEELAKGDVIAANDPAYILSDIFADYRINTYKGRGQ